MTYISAGNVGLTSTANSTSTPLAGSATFTGTAERNGFNDLLVMVTTDQPGTLYVDASADGTNWDSTLTFAVAAGVPDVHRLVKGNRYVRVRFTNASASAQTYLRLTVEFGSFGPLTSPLNLPIGRDADSLVSRGTDRNLDLAEGNWAGVAAETKFGYNSNVATSEEDIWAGGGVYTGFLTAASTVRVKAGGDANDAAAGTGARTIRVVGLDQDWNETAEDLTLAGASASAATATTFIRVFRAYVLTTGTYHASNVGAITIEETGGAAVVALIEAAAGQTQLAIFSVPAGKTAYLSGYGASVEGTKQASIFIWRAEAADDVASPYTGKRLIRQHPGVTGEMSRSLEQYVEIAEKSDVWVSAIGPSGGAGIAAHLDLFVVTN